MLVTTRVIKGLRKDLKGPGLECKMGSTLKELLSLAQVNEVRLKKRLKVL
jgi:hypothetical protein